MTGSAGSGGARPVEALGDAPLSAFGRELGGQFRPTAHAASPWDHDTVHGGAVAGLFAHVAETLDALVPMEVARMTIDLLRPVPRRSPLTIEQRLVRQGKRLQLVDLVMAAGGTEVAQARVVMVERSQALPHGKRTIERGPALPSADAPRFRLPPGFADLMTLVEVDGGPGRDGRGTMWFRSDYPLIEGEMVSPLIRAVVAADFGGGISFPFSFDDWSFPSVDLTVSLHRPPSGAWTMVEAVTAMTEDRVAICRATLHDDRGPFAHSLQSLMIRPARSGVGPMRPSAG